MERLCLLYFQVQWHVSTQMYRKISIEGLLWSDRNVRYIETRKEAKESDRIYFVQFHDGFVQHLQLSQTEGEFEILKVILSSAK